MSEILEDFISPYLELAHNYSERERLVSIALVAWNLSIVPESNRQAMLDSQFQTMFKEGEQFAQQDIRELITAMMERKQQEFADDRQIIMDFQLQDLDDGFHLSVASTLVKTKCQKLK
ncbi:MAG: hypothetical protein AAGB19_11815 [Cyanobacteria bacterium P01_F01_bin.3]